jgi:NAD(P)H-dependent FMN reductase
MTGCRSAKEPARRYVVNSEKNVEQATMDLEEAVRRGGFGVLHQYDLRKTLAGKGVELQHECRILGISGSLRAGSYNTALLRAAQFVAGPTIEFEVATLHGIPLCDGDLEQREGVPMAVRALKDKVAASDGVLLATPEYNNGIPGVLKNAIDWLSRPPDDSSRVFGDRPFALTGASPSGFGTILAQSGWLPVLRTLRVRFWSGGRLMVSRASQVFDARGEITDAATREQVRRFTVGFAAFAAQCSSERRR